MYTEKKAERRVHIYNTLTHTYIIIGRSLKFFVKSALFVIQARVNSGPDEKKKKRRDQSRVAAHTREAKTLESLSFACSTLYIYFHYFLPHMCVCVCVPSRERFFVSLISLCDTTSSYCCYCYDSEAIKRTDAFRYEEVGNFLVIERSRAGFSRSLSL